MANPFIADPDYFDRKVRGMWITGQGRAFHTHGDQGGLQGVWNAMGQVAGIWDAPVQTTWKQGAFEEGSKPKAVKRLHRDMTLGFHIIDTPGSGAEENESDFRSVFDYLPDEWDDEPEPTTLHVDTDQSGVRRLDLLMHAEPELDAVIDPVQQQYFNLIMRVRAARPDWYELDPDTGREYRSVFESSSTNAQGFIEVENPTDRPMLHKWVLTRATWRIPDFSWKGGRGNRRPAGQFGNRMISLKPITAVQGGIVISLDKQHDLPVRDHNYTNALPALLPNGQHFMHVIPPYTPKTRLPIEYIDAPAGGARAELVQPRRWSRPWGLELRR